MRKKLTKNTNTEIAEIPKFRAEPDAISRLAQDIKNPNYPEAYKKKIMYEWLDYSNTAERRLSLKAFARLKGLRASTIESWAIKDSWFKAMLEEGFLNIGDIREDKALFKEIDKDVFKWTQDKYDNEWKDRIIFFIQKQLEQTTDPKQFQDKIRDIMRDYDSRI